MDWVQFATFLITNLVFVLGLWLWNRAENRADLRHVDSILDSQRNLIMAIHEEMKDFHGRLCAIEERGKK